MLVMIESFVQMLNVFPVLWFSLSYGECVFCLMVCHMLSHFFASSQMQYICQLNSLRGCLMSIFCVSQIGVGPEVKHAIKGPFIKF